MKDRNQIIFRVDDVLKKRIAQRALDLDISRAELIKNAINDYLETAQEIHKWQVKTLS